MPPRRSGSPRAGRLAGRRPAGRSRHPRRARSARSRRGRACRRRPGGCEVRAPVPRAREVGSEVALTDVAVGGSGEPLLGPVEQRVVGTHDERRRRGGRVGRRPSAPAGDRHGRARPPPRSPRSRASCRRRRTPPPPCRRRPARGCAASRAACTWSPPPPGRPAHRPRRALRSRRSAPRGRDRSGACRRRPRRPGRRCTASPAARRCACAGYASAATASRFRSARRELQLLARGPDVHQSNDPRDRGRNPARLVGRRRRVERVAGIDRRRSAFVPAAARRPSTATRSRGRRRGCNPGTRACPPPRRRSPASSWRSPRRSSSPRPRSRSRCRRRRAARPAARSGRTCRPAPAARR